MPAKHIALASPVHDLERQAIRFIVDGLPDGYTVYSNAWLVERTGAVYELDAIVAAPHALYVVEIKSYRGEVQGNDNDWWIPEAIRSPLRLNRRTAQVLASALRHANFDAGAAWVEGLVFLSHTTDVRVTGPASQGRVHTRRTLLEELQNPGPLKARAGRLSLPPVSPQTLAVLHQLLSGADPRRRPTHRVREYQILATIERTERYTEHLARHELLQTINPAEARRVLRVYPIDPLLSDEERRHIEERYRWEAQVLTQIGDHRALLHADPPFHDPEAGMCLAFEHFEGVSLLTWIERFHRDTILSGPKGLQRRVELWQRIAQGVRHAHRQGVVHRLLRPEVILVQPQAESPEVRVTGFDLAKQLRSTQTVLLTTLTDDRLRYAAPEVLTRFSDATQASDQFGLGLLLALLLAGRPLYQSTQELLDKRAALRQVRDANPGVPKSLDDVIARMLAERPAQRFPRLDDAIQAVLAAADARRQGAVPAAPRLDPENLPEGALIEPDYQVVERLGQGGLATVYAARHLPSGTTRALKVARPEPAAEDALRAEERALRRLDHPQIVKARDLSKVVPERLTLVLERVKGHPLSRWLTENADPDPPFLHRCAEHLLGALAYLEQAGVTHKDLKPDNLLIGEDGLTVIDFSLAEQPEGALLIGTALYRDPALRTWDAEADRYAAALCLFELYTGRHPFDGQAPAPGEDPDLPDGSDDLPPALCAFFRRALSAERAARFPSAVAMRAAFVQALGGPVAAPVDPKDPDADAPLASAGLSPAALAVLRRAQIHSAGQLVALSEAQLDNISGLGKKKRQEVAALRDRLQQAGVQPGAAPPPRPLWPQLIGDSADLHRLGLSSAVLDLLLRHGYLTIGRLAEASRQDLAAIASLTPARFAQVSDAMQQYAERQGQSPAPTSLAALWARATAPLTGRQEPVLAGTFGLAEHPPRTGQDLAAALDLSAPEVSRLLNQALERLDRVALSIIADRLDPILDARGGILSLAEAARDLRAQWPAAESTSGDEPSAAGIIRVVQRLTPTRFTLCEGLDGVPGAVLLRPTFPEDALRGFLRAALRLSQWPLSTPEAARRTLLQHLPDYEQDPLMLCTRLLPDVLLTGSGELFTPPVEPAEAIGYVLRRARPPLTLDDLWQGIEHAFGEAGLLLSRERLPEALSRLPEYRVVGDRVEAAGGGSLLAPERPSGPAVILPGAPVPQDRTPEAELCERLRAAGEGPGYRLLVTPPERHPEIGRSVARALGMTFVSFEHGLLERMEPQAESFQRAERFLAQRLRLVREAEAHLQSLLSRHGAPDARVVLGDTGILGVCAALHLVRRLYDECQGGGRGFWVLVIPGVLSGATPYFNERDPVFHMDGSTMSLAQELAA